LGIGRIILRRGMANASITAKIFTLESGKMTNVMERWAICSTKRGTDTVENGKKTISTAKGPFTTKMVRNSWGNFILTRKMDMEH